MFLLDFARKWISPEVRSVVHLFKYNNCEVYACEIPYRRVKRQSFPTYILKEGDGSLRLPNFYERVRIAQLRGMRKDNPLQARALTVMESAMKEWYNHDQLAVVFIREFDGKDLYKAVEAKYATRYMGDSLNYVTVSPNGWIENISYSQSMIEDKSMDSIEKAKNESVEPIDERAVKEERAIVALAKEHIDEGTESALHFANYKGNRIYMPFYDVWNYEKRHELTSLDLIVVEPDGTIRITEKEELAEILSGKGVEVLYPCPYI